MGNELINSCYKRFVAGDKEAFAKIVDEFREGLIYFINRYVNNMDVAEDLSEDVFVELLINPKRYNFTTSLKTYLFTIGRNKAVDYIRKNRRIAGALDEGSAGVSDSFEEKYCKKEIEAAMHRIIKGLHSDYRTVLHLLYFEDMTYEEAGRVMKKSKKQIANLSYRAKQTLKAALEKEGYEYEE